MRDVSGLLNLAAQEMNPTIFKNKTFKFIEVLHLSRDLAVALKYLHSQVHQDAMILHRDLKPENILLESTKDDSPIKVIDFGTSRVFQANTKMVQRLGTVGNLSMPLLIDIIALLHCS